jgi:hypothetical protein
MKTTTTTTTAAKTTTTAKTTTAWEWYVIARYEGISGGVYRKVGEIVSRHRTYEAAARKARQSSFWGVVYASDWDDSRAI